MIGRFIRTITARSSVSLLVGQTVPLLCLQWPRGVEPTTNNHNKKAKEGITNSMEVTINGNKETFFIKDGNRMINPAMSPERSICFSHSPACFYVFDWHGLTF